MFSCELDDIKSFTSVFTCISQIIDTVTLETDSDGVRLCALDRAHVNFIEVDFKKEYFNSFHVDEPEKIIVDADEFLNVLKRARKDDTLNIQLDDSGAGLRLEFTGASTRLFIIRLLEEEYDSPMPPSLDLVVDGLSVPFREFKDSIVDASLYSDKVRLSADDTYFSISSGGDEGEYCEQYVHDGLSIASGVSSCYSVENIVKFLKADRVSNSVDVSLGDDSPLILGLKDFMGNVVLRFLCAPRLESEE